MALPKHMMDTAVRIIGDIPDARTLAGTRRGTIGTGFVIVVPSETLKDVRYAYIATAHHVIDAQRKIEVQATNPFTVGGELYPSFELTDWRQPVDGVDLVLCPVHQDNEDGGDQTLQASAMASEMLPPEVVPSLGTTIYYIGYLEPLDRMMVRSGTVGAQEVVGMRHSQPEYDYDAHLVDCRSYGGFSGSPCFFRQSHPVLLEKQDRENVYGLPDNFKMPIGNMVHVSVLCGMFTEHLDDIEPKEDGVVSRYGVGVMLPSQHIWRAVMTDDMQDERRKWDEKREQADAESGPTLRGAKRRDPGDDDEFARFERLAKQLANTKKPTQEAEGE